MADNQAVAVYVRRLRFRHYLRIRGHGRTALEAIRILRDDANEEGRGEEPVTTESVVGTALDTVTSNDADINGPLALVGQ